MTINFCMLTSGALSNMQIIQISNTIHVNMDLFYDKLG